MLPTRRDCYLAGVDRLSFSVIWELDLDGNILSQWTGKTVIRSCTKLAYGAAQQMIEGDFIGADGQEPPCELESPHTWREVTCLKRPLLL